MAQTFMEKAWFSPINVLRTAHILTRHAPSLFQGQELSQLCRQSHEDAGERSAQPMIE